MSRLTIFSLCLLACLLWTLPAQAQIGRMMKKKLKQATQSSNQPQSEPSVRSEPPTRSNQGSPSQQMPPSADTYQGDQPKPTSSPTLKKRDLMAEQNAPVAVAPLAFDGPLPPHPTYESLLALVDMKPKTGQLMLKEELTIAFLPTKEEGGDLARYGVKPGEHKVIVDLYRGEERLRHYCAQVMQRDGGQLRSQRKGPFADASVVLMTNGYLERQGFDLDDYTISEAGDYHLDILVDDRLIQRFPFVVRVQGSDDPYATTAGLYQLDGPWADYAYLFTPTEGGYLTWYFYDRHQEMEQTDVTYLLVAELYRNGQFVATTGNKTISARQQWKRHELSFSIPGDDAANTTDLTTSTGFTLDKMTDGNYELRVTYYDVNAYDRQGKKVPIANPMGRKEDRYRFTVQGGKIQPQDRQVREAHEGLQFIEGGRDQFWLKRVSQ